MHYTNFLLLLILLPLLFAFVFVCTFTLIMCCLKYCNRKIVCQAEQPPPYDLPEEDLDGSIHSDSGQDYFLPPKKEHDISLPVSFNV